MYGPVDQIKAITDNSASPNFLPFLESYLQYFIRIPRFDCVVEVYLSHTIDPAQNTGKRVLLVYGWDYEVENVVTNGIGVIKLYSLEGSKYSLICW